MSIVHDVTCKDCNKQVKDITEYQEMAELEGVDVNDWVAANDNLYDRASNTVICTVCYVKGIMAGRYR